MKRRFKLKIIGESPRSLLLAFVLAKLNCDVYLYDFLIDPNSKKDYQIFLFSKSLKNLLSQFDIWNEIENICYDFTSLTIKDTLVSEKLLLQSQYVSKKYLNTIGWTAYYSDLKSLLINKLINFENVNFFSDNKLIDESLIFDYELNFKNFDNNLRFFKLPLPTFKIRDEQMLIFYAYLRGTIEKRLYEINTSKGLLVLTPLNNNLYQIIWNNVPLQVKETSLSSKSLFIDNLTTLLPHELKIDQIIGEINYLNFKNISSTYFIKNKSIYFNENKFKSNTLYDFNFSIIIKIIVQIYNTLDSRKHRNIYIFNKFRAHYFTSKCIEIIINLSFSDFLFTLFKINNIFSLSIRKLLFTLFKRINLIKILYIGNIKNLNKYNLIK